ncbi:MAG: hypothetical protein DI562_22550 [Stenotrophomonas acidaminiphila]|nr:MAG: hypothetical protein DI562_22550 [Stenotrophomonas acidaminiphila]
MGRRQVVGANRGSHCGQPCRRPAGARLDRLPPRLQRQQALPADPRHPWRAEHRLWPVLLDHPQPVRGGGLHRGVREPARFDRLRRTVRHDLMSIVDEVAKRPYVDGRNLFIGGGSGGGVLTLWGIGKEPDKFRAAVALRPVVDWTDQVTTADLPSFFMKHWMGAAPWDKPELYFARSPYSLAGQMKTPTMLITGEQDFRTPMSQTEQMFGALKLRGVEVEMVRLPGAGHGMGRPSQWLQSVLAPIDFFNRGATSVANARMNRPEILGSPGGEGLTDPHCRVRDLRRSHMCIASDPAPQNAWSKPTSPCTPSW